MNVNEIETLLSRYYSGHSSQAEEEALKQFFAQEEAPTHLTAEKELFTQLASLSGPEAPQGLEGRLDRLIDRLDCQERRAAGRKKRAFIARLQWMGGIAAGLLLLFLVDSHTDRTDTPAVRQDTCATPEEAYVETRKALLLFSSALNKITERMAMAHQTANKMQENVTLQLGRIKKQKR